MEVMDAVVMPGIGNDVHRVAWVEINQSIVWKKPRLEVRAACGMRMIPGGTLIRPQVGEVTCPVCLDWSA